MSTTARADRADDRRDGFDRGRARRGPRGSLQRLARRNSVLPAGTQRSPERPSTSMR
jgi:hypothetical protein